MLRCTIDEKKAVYRVPEDTKIYDVVKHFDENHNLPYTKMTVKKIFKKDRVVSFVLIIFHLFTEEVC